LVNIFYCCYCTKGTVRFRFVVCFVLFLVFHFWPFFFASSLGFQHALCRHQEELRVVHWPH
jgi:hypothetical protein